MGQRLTCRAGGPSPVDQVDQVDHEGGHARHVGRRSLALLGLVSAETLLAAVLALVAVSPGGVETRREAAAARRSNRALVSALGLTDLALFSGASQTRHPSQADRFAAFSDHPAALDRSPAGSVVPAPRPPESRP